MTMKLVRGRLLTFTQLPKSAEDETSYLYEDDGALLLSDGKIIGFGAYSLLRLDVADDIEVIDHRPNLILPGFIDTHLHFPQMQVVGSYAANLLEWLNTYTFVEEQRFGDPEHAKRIAGLFLDELANQGTTTAAAYCSVHRQSADALFEAAAARNMCMIAGKVMMDRNAPDALTDTPESSFDDTVSVIEQWHGVARNHVAITPRFAITSSPEQLEMAGALAAKYPDCHIQTHLSENDAEIALTAELYPQAKNYTDVYAGYGLLTPRTLLGHAIHLDPAEIALLAETRSVAVHCPTSNLFLGSGLFDRSGLMASGVRIAMATDIGGGTNYSMLKTMDEAYKVSQMRGNRITPLESFYHLTRGNAEALGLEGEIGTLEPSTAADFVVLDSSATSAMKVRMETVSTLSEELFLLQTLGDDRAVVATYIAGERLK